MSELIISISGMRGIIGENLFPSTASEYGCAFGSYLKKHKPDTEKLKVCIGRDSRPSGNMLFSALAAGLCAAGADVVDLGLVTTPCVGIMVRHLGCDGAAVITASHNPIEYNGIKLLLDNGMAPPKTQAEVIRQMYLDKVFGYVGSIECGRICSDDSADDVHIEKVLAVVDAGLIASRKYKVVLDSVNGAGGRIGVKLLERLGCEVIGMNIEQTGIFAHTPEPTKDNLGGLCEQVAEAGADAGFAQDPDADRLAIVDEKGTYIGEEYTLALSAFNVLEGDKSGAAANLSTSRMIDDVAARFGCKVIRTPVGEANVADAMMKNGSIIGGEGNGGVIDTRVGPVRDSLVAMALVLELMAKKRKTVRDLARQIGGYEMIKTKAPADKTQAAEIINRAREEFPDAEVDESDGCRLDFDDGWLHIRTSNTEPVMRVIAEASSPRRAKEYIETVERIQKQVISG